MLMRVSNTLLLCLFLVTASAQQHLKKFRSISGIAAIGNKVLFRADEDGDNVEELWISDGSPEGTTMVKDIVLPYSPLPSPEMVNFHNELYFVAYDPESQAELWKSDGTPNGTRMVKDLAPYSTYYGGSRPQSLRVFNDYLYFTTSDGHLYKTNGTDAGTQSVDAGAGGARINW